MRRHLNADLSKFHSLASESRAREIIEIEAIDELFAIEHEYLVLGFGCNTIFLDYIDRSIVRPLFSKIEIVENLADSVLVSAEAGANWQDLVEYSCKNNWFGIENLAGIPGTAGAAPVQNIGAYGVEIANCLEKIEVFDRKGKIISYISANDCGFAYRTSNFKTIWKEQFLITKIFIRLLKNGKINANYPGLSSSINTPLQMMRQILDVRAEKIPDPVLHPNAGSFFHNPIVSIEHYQKLQSKYSDIPAFYVSEKDVKIPAAWLIEKAGWKGKFEGKVGISSKHAVILLNYHAKGRDILDFAQRVYSSVYDIFSIKLEIEPNIVRY